jgi:hypothetical protein
MAELPERVSDGFASEDLVILDAPVTPNIQEKQKNVGRPKHPIWKYFLSIKKNGEHDGAECLYCHDKWEHGKPSEMEVHLAKQCKSVPSNIKAMAIQYLRDRPLIKAKKKRKSGQTQLDDYYEDDQIDNQKIERANRALIRLFACCGIPFHVVDHPFFIDFVKSLCFSYDPPGRTMLSNTLLNAEIAEVLVNTNEILKKSENLTLGTVNFNF